MHAMNQESLCAGCHKAISERRFLVHGKEAFHESCFQRLHGVSCYVCNQYISGVYYEDLWGKFCASHECEAKCFTCSKIVSAEGGMLLNDGRSFCHSCRKTAVTDLVSAKAVMQEVSRFFSGRLKLKLPKRPLEFRFLPWSNGASEQGCLGYTKNIEMRDLFGRRVSRDVEYIGVLTNLPVLHFSSVVAHEIFHAWEFLEGITTTRITSEGMAELCAWLWLGEHSSPQALILRKRIETNRDAIYGEGFRIAYRAFERHGFDFIIRHLGKNGGIPH